MQAGDEIMRGRERYRPLASERSLRNLYGLTM